MTMTELQDKLNVDLNNKKIVNLETGEEQQFKTKSALFKHLYDEFDLSVSEVAKLADARYQFVYSVLDAHTNGNVRTSRAGNSTSKSQMFRDLYDQGYTVGEIAKGRSKDGEPIVYNDEEVEPSNYTFVFTVIKKYRQEKGEMEEEAADNA